MVMDIDIEKLRNNCFRQSKVSGEFMLQLRVPGAVMEAKWLEPVITSVIHGGMEPFILG